MVRILIFISCNEFKGESTEYWITTLLFRFIHWSTQNNTLYSIYIAYRRRFWLERCFVLAASEVILEKRFMWVSLSKTFKCKTVKKKKSLKKKQKNNHISLNLLFDFNYISFYHFNLTSLIKKNMFPKFKHIDLLFNILHFLLENIFINLFYKSRFFYR